MVLVVNNLALEHVSCDLCNSSSYVEVYRKPDDRYWITNYTFSVVKCEDCGLMYLNPRPTQDSMAQFYPNNYHDNRNSEAFIQRYDKQITFLPFLNNQKLLDIGCARGDFLSRVKTRFPEIECWGLDYYSTKVTNPEIHFIQSLMPVNDLKSDYFDIVTAWAVMEHLLTPSQYFAETSRVLKKGGEFIFLVPNANSIWSLLGLRDDLPRHTFQFSQNSIKKYAQKFGFEVQQIIFDDSLFDGRGHGTFKILFQKILLIKWNDLREKNLNLFQKTILKLASYIDRSVFYFHWKKKLRISGTMIVKLKKL